MPLRIRTKSSRPSCARPARAGFTLAEVLVALALMGFVVPVVVQGLRVASLAGEVSQRKSLAAMIGDRVLNEAIFTGQFQSAGGGTEHAGPYEFTWKLQNMPWTAAALATSMYPQSGINQNAVNSSVIHEVSVVVSFTAQGKQFDVKLSTLVNTSQQYTAAAPPPMIVQ